MGSTWDIKVTGDGMHSSDRTMLAKLGFADKDRKTPRHDMACLYLSQPEVAQKIVDLLGPVQFEQDYKDEELVERLPSKIKVNLEHHLQKGAGQYATTIGFLDVVYEVTSYGVMSYTDWCYEHKKRCLKHRKRERIDYFFAEVKIEPIGYGEILRQLNLYRSYFSSKIVPGLLVTDWVLSAHEKTAIEAAGYPCLHLGQKFQEWSETIERAKEPKSNGL